MLQPGAKKNAEEAIQALKTQTGKDNIHFLQLDLQDLSSVKAAAQQFLAQETQLHQLYNNAGIFGGLYKETEYGCDSIFATNVMGPFAFTKLLLPILESTASTSPPGDVRVINVSSSAHKRAPPGGIVFDDLGLIKGSYPIIDWNRYGQSKLGNILVSNELFRRYASKGIYSLSLHPGAIKTSIARDYWEENFITRFFKWIALYNWWTPEMGAITPLYAGTSGEVVEKNLNGAFFFPFGKVVETTAYGRDEELALKLWEFLDGEVSRWM